MIRLFSRYVDQDAFVAGFVDKRIPHFYRERTEFPEHQRRCSGAVLRMVFLLDELLLFLSCGQFASCCSIFFQCSPIAEGLPTENGEGVMMGEQRWKPEVFF